MLKWLSLSLMVILLDQASKAIATSFLVIFNPVPLFPSFNLTLMHNEGAAFSFLSDAGGWQRWFFAILASIVSIAIVIWMKKLKEHEKATAVALGLILGGALGNLIDRVRFGYVVDFIDVYYGTAHWPAFNIADSAITLGAAIMIIASFKRNKEQEKNETTN